MKIGQHHNAKEIKRWHFIFHLGNYVDSSEEDLKSVKTGSRGLACSTALIVYAGCKHNTQRGTVSLNNQASPTPTSAKRVELHDEV